MTDIEVDDHGSGDALAITLGIRPFMPRTFYCSGKIFGCHSGEVPEHLEDYADLLFQMPVSCPGRLLPCGPLSLVATGCNKQWLATPASAIADRYCVIGT
ncbi:hypothetical protein [Xanthobacter autotrophicus]|uniref:hypothetical protein n=1 Tax=Xanthobacter autotrophicus TaxID=280 RepID=UPI0024A6BAAD|nr:hypothetical protein [Xanthobacter autotrophicus]MDI4655844.1 hypothetical protein [Xanthobacter autotrophicus]